MKSVTTSQNSVYPTGYFMSAYFSWVTSYSTGCTHIPNSTHLSQTQSVLDSHPAHNSSLHEMVKTNSQSCEKVLLKQIIIKQTGACQLIPCVALTS